MSFELLKTKLFIPPIRPILKKRQQITKYNKKG